MKHIKHTFLRFAAWVTLGFSTAGFANGEFLGEQTKIDRIRTYDGHAVVFTKSSITAATCATTNTAFILTLEESDFGGRKYSTLLAALAADKVFNPWCEDKCQEKWGTQYTLCGEASIQ